MINDSFDLIAGSITGLILLGGGVWVWNKLCKFKNTERKCVYIRGLMVARTCVDGVSQDEFRLYKVSGDVTPEQYFVYVMNGLCWPVVTNVTYRATHTYVDVISVSDGGSTLFPTTLWFFGRDTCIPFVKDLNNLFEAYMEAGCPPRKVEEPVESIVARARGETVDLLNKYGFVWSEGS